MRSKAGLQFAIQARQLLLSVALVIGTAISVAPSAHADTFTALVVGDSISAAYGLRESEGWVALAEAQLRDQGHDVDLVNASISGDTTVGGLKRLPQALERFEPDLVIIELGGNDGLRGYSPAAIRSNLEQMATLAQNNNAEVLILGMMIPSNYGQAYLEQFARTFVDAAESTGSVLIPFLMEPFARDRSYFLPDGIHPNAEAQPLMVEHVMPELLRFVESE